MSVPDNKSIHVYTLTDPRDNKIRYVGITVDLKKRYSRHCNPKKDDLSHRANRLRVLKNNNLKPLITEIDICEKSELEHTERYWIQYYKDLGYDLTNATNGGEHFEPSEETKIKQMLNPKKSVKSKSATSRYNGVFWSTNYNIWNCTMRFYGKSHQIGIFDDELLAAYSVDVYIKEKFPEFSFKLNFPTQEIPDDIVNLVKIDKNKTQGYKDKMNKSMYSAMKRKLVEGFFGIRKLKGCNSYQGRLCKYSKTHYTKCFSNPLEAAYAYNLLAQELYGKDTRLNEFTQEELSILNV